jgi:tight adherence protein B
MTAVPTAALVSGALAAAALCAVRLPRRSGGRLQDVVVPASSLCTAPRRSRCRSAPVLPLAGLVAALVVASLLGPVPALLAAAAAGAASRVHRGRQASRRRDDERARAVEACGALASELRAGRTPADALAAAAELATGPSRAALVAAAGATRLGGDTAGALRPPDGTAVPDVLRSLAACWTVCAGSGSGLAAAVQRLEEGLRADQAQRRAVDAELAGPRATAALLAVLPAAGLLLASGLGADPLRVLLSTPVGLACLTVGLLLDALGLWWTGRLVARAGGGG